MECRDSKLLIEAYWDRHLAPEMVERVERHLRSCRECRAEYGPVTRLLSSPEPVAMPAGLRERILIAIEPLPMPVAGRSDKSSRRQWLEYLQAPWAGALAACLTFAFLGWLSSRIPAGGVVRRPGPDASVVSAPAPHPLLAAGWAQAVAIRGPASPLAAVAQTAALETLIQGPAGAPAAYIPGRPRLPDVPPADPSPAIPELSIFVHRLSTLGA